MPKNNLAFLAAATFAFFVGAVAQAAPSDNFMELPPGGGRNDPPEPGGRNDPPEPGGRNDPPEIGGRNDPPIKAVIISEPKEAPPLSNADDVTRTPDGEVVTETTTNPRELIELLESPEYKEAVRPLGDPDDFLVAPGDSDAEKLPEKN